MTIHAENNKKTENIKISLGILLEGLEKKKQIIATRKSYLYIESRIPPYVPRDKVELLNIATSILSNLIRQFDSVDDLDSVKKLRQTELFFLKNHDLRDFAFSSYKSLIEPNLLINVNKEIKLNKLSKKIKIQLDKLSKKAKDLEGRGYHSEGIIAKGVETELKKLNHWYFEEKLIDPNDYKNRALTIIDNAKTILDQHRGCKRILINLIALISTLGIAFIINKCVNNRYLFFPETKSSEQLNKLEHTVSKLAF